MMFIKAKFVSEYLIALPMCKDSKLNFLANAIIENIEYTALKLEHILSLLYNDAPMMFCFTVNVQKIMQQKIGKENTFVNSQVAFSCNSLC